MPKALPAFIHATVAFVLSFAALARIQPASGANSQAATPPAAPQQAEERTGPFAVSGENYTVFLRYQRQPGTAVSGAQLVQTLTLLQIHDSAGNVAYEKSFPSSSPASELSPQLSASVQRIEGKTGAGLAIHYVERPSASQPNQSAKESWQLFGTVNGKLAPLGKPAVIGEPNPGAPFMGVVMRAANGAVSVVSQPDQIELRAWTGNFYVFVPLRVDWSHGGLAQGQRCVERLSGPLQDVGCPMRIEAARKSASEEFGFLRVFAEPHENFGEPDHVVLQKDAPVDLLGASAITAWNETNGLIQPVFSDVWLQVRINGREGWVHGEEDFAALGLPAENPAP